MNRISAISAALAGWACATWAAAPAFPRARYLDAVETAVGAYSGERIARYVERVEKNGVEEHGFPRLTANLGALVAGGRASGHRELFARMMDLCCAGFPGAVTRAKAIPGKDWYNLGNDFSIKEIVCALLAVERAGAFPRERTEGWRASLRQIEAAGTYSCQPEPGAPKSENWAVFGAASEQARIFARAGGDARWVEGRLADQMRFFDSNAMWRDPHEPAVYDLVTRLQFAAALAWGYDGPSRGKLEELLDRGADVTLRLQSACGELPFGGRSNQFLHNDTLVAALCEWYAARDAKRGNLPRARLFRRAAKRALASFDAWTARPEFRHVKNRWPLETRYGCEGYGYFDKYMVTAGSWACLAYAFADETVDPAPEADDLFAFATSRPFHMQFLAAGGYSAQVDLAANRRYDATGLGRLHRRGAPAALGLSVPCPAGSGPRSTVGYRIPGTNGLGLAYAPGWRGTNGWTFVDGAGECEVEASSAADGAAVARFRVRRSRGTPLAWTCRLSSDGLDMRLSGEGDLALSVPAFETDGEEMGRLTATARSVSVDYRGWTCRAETDGALVDTGTAACNRNGRYRRFEARGRGELAVRVRIVPAEGSANGKETAMRGTSGGMDLGRGQFPARAPRGDEGRTGTAEG